MKLLLSFFCVLFSLSLGAQKPLSKVKGMFGKKESQVQKDILFLCTTELAGRKTGTPGEAKAAQYLSERFAALRYNPYQGEFIQSFKLERANLIGPDSYIEIASEKPFVGTELLYMPYAGNGEMAAMAIPGLNEPDNLWFIKFSEVGVELNNPRGNGARKLYNSAEEAIKKGAAAVLFINDVSSSADFKKVSGDYFPPLTKPVWLLNHNAYKKYIQANLKEEWIDVNYKVNKSTSAGKGNNVVAYWSNRAAKTIVIGAHYDHLGYGSKSKRKNNLHLGADNNASGVAAMLEVANRLSALRLRNYNFMFVAFSGAEQGFFGSKKMLEQFNLDSTKINCMINIDAVGRLNNAYNIKVSGTGTSPDWEDMLGSLSIYKAKYDPSGVGQSDYQSFYRKGIPVLSFSTGKQKVHNTPRDTPDLINYTGIETLSETIISVLTEINNSPKLRFQKTKEKKVSKKLSIKVTLGMQPNENFEGTGVEMTQLVQGGVAQKAGAKEGDILIRMDAYDVKDIDMYLQELSKYKKGDKIIITVLRGGKKKQLLVIF